MKTNWCWISHHWLHTQKNPPASAPLESWYKGSVSAQCEPTPAYWSWRGQKFTAVTSELMPHIFTTILGNTDDSWSVCASGTRWGGGAHQPFHTCTHCLCNGSPALGENEHSERFPLILLVLLLTPTPLFSFHRLSAWHLNSLLSLGGGGGGGVQRFNSTASPLWLWINVHPTENGKERKSNFFEPVSLDICGRTCEFAPPCVWCLDMAWSCKVTRDISYISHGSCGGGAILRKHHLCYWNFMNKSAQA